MAETSEENAFPKLPPRLQESFFELADHATRRLSKFLRREGEKLKELRVALKFREIPQKAGKDLRVGAVDGSISPKLSERLGFRVGVYAATYMVFDG